MEDITLVQLGGQHTNFKFCTNDVPWE